MTFKHLLCNCPALSRLRLKTLGRGFFKGLNSVSREDIKALHSFIIEKCYSFISVVTLSLVCCSLVCVVPPLPSSPFPTSSPFSRLLYYPLILSTFVQWVNLSFGYCTCLILQDTCSNLNLSLLQKSTSSKDVLN